MPAQHSSSKRGSRSAGKPRQRSEADAPQRAASADTTLVQRAAQGAASPADVLRLQRAVGNRAVNEVVQAKLEVGPAGDTYEQEADRVAGEVMRMPAAPQAALGPAARQDEIQRKPLAESIQRVSQPSAAQAEQLAEQIRTQRAEPEAGFEAGSAVETRLAANQGGGRPLPDGSRAELEPKFGADFSGVRVHTGGAAAQLNRALSAEAFTHGTDIYFGQGQFDPGTGAGKHLLAHELTHVVQQGGAGVQRKPLAAGGISAGQVAPGSRLQLARGKKGRVGGSLLGSLISTPLFTLLTPLAPLLGLAGGGFMGAKMAGQAALGKKNGKQRKWKDASVGRKIGAGLAGFFGGLGGAIGGAIAAPIATALMAIPGVAGGLASEMTFGMKGERQEEAGQNVDPTHTRAKSTNIEIQTDTYVLRGRKYEPGVNTLKKKPEQLPGLGKRVVLLSGSGGPNENQLQSLGQFYAEQGSTVYAINYRGFGAGAEGSRDKSGGDESSPMMSEAGLIEDAYRTYRYARTDGGGVSANKIIVHGFSLGGAIAANLVKRVKQEDGESLGGLVLHSSIKSAYAAARDMIPVPGIAQAGGLVTSWGAGGFNTPKIMEEISKIDPNLPLHLMSGSGDAGDQLALSETGMTGGWAKGLGFKNVSESEGLGGHLNTSSHLYSNDNQQQLRDLLGTDRPQLLTQEEQLNQNQNPMYEGPQWQENPLAE